MWVNFKPSLIIFCTLIYMIVSLRLMDWYTCTGVRRGSSKSKNNCSVPWFQVHILHKMSSLVLRFNLLRNNIRTSCPVRFLKQHAGFSSGKLLQPKSYEKRHFATNLTGAVSWHKTGPGYCVPSILPLWLQQTSGHDQPATLLVFDVETTGFFHVDNRIVEFALRDLSGGKDCTFQTLINPERDVPKYASKLNKITTELVCRPDVPRCVSLLYMYAILHLSVTWIHISL